MNYILEFNKYEIGITIQSHHPFIKPTRVEWWTCKDLWMEGLTFRKLPDLSDISLVDEKKMTECQELRNFAIFWWNTMYPKIFLANDRRDLTLWKDTVLTNMKLWFLSFELLILPSSLVAMWFICMCAWLQMKSILFFFRMQQNHTHSRHTTPKKAMRKTCETFNEFFVPTSVLYRYFIANSSHVPLF